VFRMTLPLFLVFLNTSNRPSTMNLPAACGGEIHFGIPLINFQLFLILQSMVFLREVDMGEASAFYKRDRKAPDSHTHIQNRSETGLL